MIRSLALLVVLTAAAVFSLHGVFSNHYPFVLASEEARKSLEVTTAQMKELRGAELLSDMIAYAAFSALLCGALAACCSAARNGLEQIVGLVVGMVGGAVAGAVTGFLGHWLELSPGFAIDDPMIYAIVRWSIMLLPIAIAAGLATAISTKSAGKIGITIVGSVIGSVVAAMIYSMSVGTFTTIESRSKILPFHDANRMMLVGVCVFCIGAGTVLQLHRKSK
jgi:hypothetical protein